MNIKSIVQRAFRILGYRIIGRDAYDRWARQTLTGSMATAKSIGFVPHTILDIGAAQGHWTKEVADIWPEASYIMVDPLEENCAALSAVADSLPLAKVVSAAVTDYTGKTIINVHRDLDGSSLFREWEESVNGVPREVKAITLLDIIGENSFHLPALLKADVQGAELQVLKGAREQLNDFDMVILESLLFDYFRGASPQISDLVKYMCSRDFAVWDILAPSYRPLDGALSQVDIVFVREKGVFRRLHQFATEEQRLLQLRNLQPADRNRLGK